MNVAAELTREEIITEGGIPAEIFDYADSELRVAHAVWMASSDRTSKRCKNWTTERRMEIDGQWRGYFLMQPPGPRTKKGLIHVIGPAENAWGQRIHYKGPLTMESAKLAIEAAIKLLDRASNEEGK